MCIFCNCVYDEILVTRGRLQQEGFHKIGHRLEAKGDKGTIAVKYQPNPAIMKYLQDVQEVPRAILNWNSTTLV